MKNSKGAQQGFKGIKFSNKHTGLLYTTHSASHMLCTMYCLPYSNCNEWLCVSVSNQTIPCKSLVTLFMYFIYNFISYHIFVSYILHSFMCFIHLDILIISSQIALRWMPQHFTDDTSTLVQAMALCITEHGITWINVECHYLNQFWPSSMTPYGITWSQWINIIMH